jgi:hypothetical protein
MFNLNSKNPFVGSKSSKNGVDEFENAFQQMAYFQLEKSIPEVLERVATFKIADIDLKEGKAFGYFILLFDNATIYVPAILDRDNVKPLDIMYIKETKTFYPFSKSWVDYIDSLVDPFIGAPETDESQKKLVGSSPKDMSIYDVLTPPRTTQDLKKG